MRAPLCVPQVTPGVGRAETCDIPNETFRIEDVITDHVDDEWHHMDRVKGTALCAQTS